MSKFFIFVLLSYITRSPLLVLVIMLLVLFLTERRFVGILPDFFEPWRRVKRISQLKKDIAINPANADSYLELGEAYFRQGKYEKALSFLENASGKMEGHPLFHFLLGASYYNSGRVKQGKEELEKAIRANPKASLGEPHLYIVRIYLEEKQPDENVEQVFSQLLLYGTPRIFYQAGRSFLASNDKKRAHRLFRETIESYDACRGALRRANRRWAFLSGVYLKLGA
jgi:tetratricopeptide (TPR) repeat protein